MAVLMKMSKNQISIIQPEVWPGNWTILPTPAVEPTKWSSFKEKVSEKITKTEKRSFTWMVATIAAVCLVIFLALMIVIHCIKRYKGDQDILNNLPTDIELAMCEHLQN